MIENEYTLKEWGVKSQRKLTPHQNILRVVKKEGLGTICWIGIRKDGIERII